MNRKFQEIRLAVILNKMDKKLTNTQFANVVKLLTCFAETFGEEYVEQFNIFLSRSINNNILGTTDKAIIAAFVSLEKSPSDIANIIGIYYQKFIIRFNKHLKNENILNEIEQEEPEAYFDPRYSLLWSLLYKLLVNFDYPVGNKYHDLRDNKRTMEIEFYLIYSKLTEICANEALINKFVFNVCNAFNIDFNSILILKNGLIYITRTLPHFSMNGRYFKQEVVTLCINKGIKKGTIGSKIFNKGTNYLYNKNTKVFANTIRKEDMSWYYIPTINWGYAKPEEVLKFIDLFHDFIRLEY